MKRSGEHKCFPWSSPRSSSLASILASPAPHGAIAQSRRLAKALPRGVSIASLVGIIWLVMAYTHAPYVTTWGVPVWWKPVAIMLMLPAFLLAVTGLTTSNPTIVGEEGGGAPARGHRAGYPPSIPHRGRIVGVVHLIANGNLASFIFFGSLAVTALAGTVSIDTKRRRALGRGWQSFAVSTPEKYAAAAGAKVQHGRSKKAPDIGGLLACRRSFLRGASDGGSDRARRVPALASASLKLSPFISMIWT